MLIYENIVKKKGELVEAFGNDMFILFGDNAPDTLRDYCYSITVKNTNGKIEKGQYIVIDGEEFEILGVGNIAERNLVELGHITVSFSGDLETLLPGTIIVEKGSSPDIEVGTKIEIISK